MNGFDENGTTVGNSKTAGKNMGQFGSTQDVINKRLSIHVGYWSSADYMYPSLPNLQLQNSLQFMKKTYSQAS